MGFLEGCLTSDFRAHLTGLGRSEVSGVETFALLPTVDGKDPACLNCTIPLEFLGFAIGF